MVFSYQEERVVCQILTITVIEKLEELLLRNQYIYIYIEKPEKLERHRSVLNATEPDDPSIHPGWMLQAQGLTTQGMKAHLQLQLPGHTICADKGEGFVEDLTFLACPQAWLPSGCSLNCCGCFPWFHPHQHCCHPSL